MTDTVYVSNLAFDASEDDIRNYFSLAGTVTKVQIISDRETRRSRGFGFVSYSTPEEAASAISKLNNTEFHGRTLRISEARPKGERSTAQNNTYRHRPQHNQNLQHRPRINSPIKYNSEVFPTTEQPEHTKYDSATRQSLTGKETSPKQPLPLDSSTSAASRSRFGPPKKKFQKHKGPGKYPRDDFDERPKSRKPRFDAFDEEEDY